MKNSCQSASKTLKKPQLVKLVSVCIKHSEIVEVKRGSILEYERNLSVRESWYTELQIMHLHNVSSSVFAMKDEWRKWIGVVKVIHTLTRAPDTSTLVF